MKAIKTGQIISVLKSKFFRDTAYLQAGVFITAFSYIITSVLLARSLGPEDLGRYDLAYRFYGLCYFLANMGVINVSVISYSQAAGRNDAEGKLTALASFLRIYFLIALLIVTLGFFICPWSGEFFYLDSDLGYYGWILCILGLIEIVKSFVTAALLGARFMKQIALYESAIAIVRVLVLVLAIVGGFALAGVIYGSVISAVISSFMGIRLYALARKYGGDQKPPKLKKVILAVAKAPIRHFFSLGVLIAINKNLSELKNIFATFFMGF